jgi:hypothetical protein
MLSQLKVEEVKTLTLDSYRAMLNIRPLGEQRDSILCYCILFHSKEEKLGVGN